MKTLIKIISSIFLFGAISTSAFANDRQNKPQLSFWLVLGWLFISRG